MGTSCRLIAGPLGTLHTPRNLRALRKVHTLQMLSCLGVRLRAEEAFSPSSFSSRTQQAFCKYIRLSKTHVSKFSTNKMHAHQRRLFKKKSPNFHQSFKKLGDIQGENLVIFENSPGFTRFLKNHHFQANFTTKTHETKVKLLLLLIFETSLSKNHQI